MDKEKKYQHRITGRTTVRKIVVTNGEFEYEMSDEDVLPCWYVEDSSDWVEVTESEQVSEAVYEIAAYRHIPTSEATGKPVVTWKHEKRPWWEVAEANIDNEYAINTVRRFSDGELFQIGDKVWSVTKSLGVFTIKGFIVDEEAGGGLAITTNEGTMQIAITCAVKYQEPEEQVVSMVIDGIGYKLKVRDAELIKTKAVKSDLLDQKLYAPVQEPERVPVMVTEDNVKYHSRESIVYGVGKGSWNTVQYTVGEVITQTIKHWKWFSTPEERTEWIMTNKPVFSIKDIQSNKNIHLSDAGLQALEHIAKERINQNK